MSRALLFVVGVVGAWLLGWRAGYHFATDEESTGWTRVGPTCAVKWEGQR